VARRSILLAFLVATTVLLLAGPAAAASLEIRPAGCGQVTVTGSGLAPGKRLSVAVTDGFSGARLGQASVTTSADGGFSARVRVSLRNLAAVGAEASDNGRIVLGATHNLDDRLRAQCGGAAGGSGALPFTGPAQAYVLLAIGVGLLGIGGLMRASFAYRARH
jgi:hypothetical protein